MCIYHGNCADGFGAAWSIWKKFPDIIFFPGVYGQDGPDCRGHHVLFVDFSYPEHHMRSIAAQAKSVTVLDHHKSAEANLSKLMDEGVIYGTFDMEKSGAMLAWEWAFPDLEPPMLLRHIQDRDLWKFELPRTEDIQAALFSHPYDFHVWNELFEGEEAAIETLAREGQAITRKHKKDIEELLKVTTRSMVIGGKMVPVANLPYTMASDACHKLCVTDFEALGGKPPFAASYYDKPGLRVFSLRSIEGGEDVSEIARKYGGGGHKHAAGFAVTIGWEGDEGSYGHPDRTV